MAYAKLTQMKKLDTNSTNSHELSVEMGEVCVENLYETLRRQ